MRKKIQLFDNGEQIPIIDYPENLIEMHVELDHATETEQIEIEATEEEFTELRKKARTNSIDIDTISATMKVKNPEKENKKADK